MDNQQERLAFNKGWLVGIIDGEGCFTLNGKCTSWGRAYFPTIQITNTNLHIIEKAKAILSDLGLTCYFYARLPKKGRPYYRLEIAGLKRVKRFLDVLGDCLECRREQSDLLSKYVFLRLSKVSHAPLGDEEHLIAEALRKANNRTQRILRDFTPSIGPTTDEDKVRTRAKSLEVAEMSTRLFHLSRWNRSPK